LNYKCGGSRKRRRDHRRRRRRDRGVATLGGSVAVDRLVDRKRAREIPEALAFFLSADKSDQ